MKGRVGKKKDHRQGVVTDARIAPAARGASKAWRDEGEEPLARHQLIERLDLTLWLIVSVAEPERVHRGLNLGEIVGRSKVELEWIIEAGLAIRAYREITEACHAKSRIGDGVVDAGGDAIAEMLADPPDLFAHAEGHIDEEDHIGRADAASSSSAARTGSPSRGMSMHGTTRAGSSM